MFFDVPNGSVFGCFICSIDVLVRLNEIASRPEYPKGHRLICDCNVEDRKNANGMQRSHIRNCSNPTCCDRKTVFGYGKFLRATMLL